MYVSARHILISGVGCCLNEERLSRLERGMQGPGATLDLGDTKVWICATLNDLALSISHPVSSVRLMSIAFPFYSIVSFETDMWQAVTKRFRYLDCLY